MRSSAGGVMRDVVYAGFWRRLAAHIIDGIICWVVLFLFGWIVSGLSLTSTSPLSLWLPETIGVVYSSFFLASKWQATPGKRLLSVYVGALENGGRISAGKAIFRYVVLNAGGIYFLVVAANITSSYITDQTFAADQQRMKEILQKQLHQQYLTSKEQDLLFRTNRINMANQAGLSPEETQRYMDIGDKEIKKIPLTEEEKSFKSSVASRMLSNGFKMLLQSIPALIYGLVVPLMVGMTREKTGPHDLAVGTRVLRGKPGTLTATQEG